MALNPEVLKKAQDEIDEVIGYDRLPTLQDRDVLPYVHALCKETSRWVCQAVHLSSTQQHDNVDLDFCQLGSWQGVIPLG